jgi:hypothetical protein
MIEYTRQRLRAANQDSAAIKWVLCLCACYFWCLDKFMQFVNKNAYTVIALTKKGFCAAAYEAFVMILANAVRMATLNAVSTLFLAFGKYFVALVATAIAYIVLTQVSPYKDTDSADGVSPFFPCLVVFILGYAIGSLFMAVYDSTIDAMLLVWIYEEKHHFLDRTTKDDICVNLKALADQCNDQLGPNAHGFSAEEQQAARAQAGVDDSGGSAQPGTYVVPSTGKKA